MVDTIGLANAVAGAPSYSGRALRQLNGVGFAGATSARPLGVRSGVRPGTSTTTVTATSTTWTCGPFAGIADVMVAAESGGYPFSFDGTATGSVTAASGSYARVDLLYVLITDPENGSTVPTATRMYQAGIAAYSPVAPATPAGGLAIANINVPVSGGGSPTVTWVAPYAVAAGGILPVPSSASYPASPYVGQQADDAVLGGTIRWNGSVWAPVVPKQPTRGTATVTTDASGLASITHGLGAVPSVVLLSPAFTNETVSSVFAPTRGALTSTTIQLVAYRNDSHVRLAGTSVTVDWVAFP